MNHAAQLADAHDLPIAMHLAETPQERELLEHQSGPFVGLLQQLGTWNPNDFGEDRQSWHYLERLSQISRGLLIHGNYLTDKELDWISQQAGLHVVYCPRTHRFFEHASYPLQAMLDRSINVAVGTDSRASNPNLNLFEELKFLSTQFSQLDPMQVLRLGTLNGASALGMEQRYGTLEKGKSSRLAVIRSNQPSSVNVSGSLDWLFSTHSTCHPLRSEHLSQ
jgi:cytosine/adenosine deaminase-related metal-dependent hydrolase